MFSVNGDNNSGYKITMSNAYLAFVSNVPTRTPRLYKDTWFNNGHYGLRLLYADTRFN